MSFTPAPPLRGPFHKGSLWADRVVRPYKVQWGLGKEGGEVGLGRGGRCDGIVLGEEVQDVRREERRERRPETDTLDAEVQEGEIPGEAVYTNSGSVSSLSGARLLKEQTRAKNKETLLEIINNANIAENQKQEAVDEMIAREMDMKQFLSVRLRASLA